MKDILYKTRIVVLEVQEIDQDILASINIRHEMPCFKYGTMMLMFEGTIALAAEKS
jgi:hypothetical protein